MIHEPILVIGIARSGTSTVARILHEELGVSMGHDFPDPDDNNPKGYYEDLIVKDLNKGFVQGRLSYREWFVGTFKYISDRLHEHIPWGVKNVRLASLLGLYLQFFDNPLIIRCVRDPDLVVNSHIKCFSHRPDMSKLNVILKTQALNRILRGREHLVVEFGEERRTDGELIKLIGGYIEEQRPA